VHPIRLRVRAYFAKCAEGDIQHCMLETEDYAVCVTRCGTASALFGWEILRIADAHVVARSSTAFSTRFEALADSVQAAASQALGGKSQGRKLSSAKAQDKQP
jgi:hypothetical protein